MKRFNELDEGFICENCGKEVTPAGTVISDFNAIQPLNADSISVTVVGTLTVCSAVQPLNKS